MGRDAAEVGTTFTERTHFPGASTRLEAFRLDQWIPESTPITAGGSKHGRSNDDHHVERNRDPEPRH